MHWHMNYFPKTNNHPNSLSQHNFPRILNKGGPTENVKLNYTSDLSKFF